MKDNGRNMKDALIDRDDDINPFEEEYSSTQDGPTMRPYEPILEEEPAQQAGNSKPEPVAAGSTSNIFSRLSPYFQVDSITLQRKIVTALKLKELGSLRDEEIQNNVQLDLYSAVWITATVVMALFICTSGAVVLESIIKNQLLPMTDFDKMLNDLFLFYGYLFFAPLALYLVSRFMIKEPIDPVSTIDCYGMSNVVWIPVAFLYVLTGLFGPVRSWLRWGLVVLAAFYSGLIVGIQIKSLTREISKGKMLFHLSIFLHVLFALLVRLIVM